MKPPKKDVSKYTKTVAWVSILFGIVGLLFIGLTILTLLIPSLRAEILTEYKPSLWTNIPSFVIDIIFILSSIFTLKVYGKKVSKFYKYNAWLLFSMGILNLVETIRYAFYQGSIDWMSPIIILEMGFAIISSVSLIVNGLYLRKVHKLLSKKESDTGNRNFAFWGLEILTLFKAFIIFNPFIKALSNLTFYGLLVYTPVLIALISSVIGIWKKKWWAFLLIVGVFVFEISSSIIFSYKIPILKSLKGVIYSLIMVVLAIFVYKDTYKTILKKNWWILALVTVASIIVTAYGFQITKLVFDKTLEYSPNYAHWQYVFPIYDGQKFEVKVNSLNQEPVDLFLMSEKDFIAWYYGNDTSYYNEDGTILNTTFVEYALELPKETWVFLVKNSYNNTAKVRLEIYRQ